MEHSDTNGGFDLESPLPFAYGTFGPRSSVGSIPSGGENLWNSNGPNNNNNQLQNSNTSVLLSPSYSRRSRSGIANSFAGSRVKRGSMASQIDLLEEQQNIDQNDTFLPISKYIIGYLTFICCLLIANMSQMIVLYNILSDDDHKKYLLIYVIFPFITFIFLKLNDVNLCNQIRNLFDFGYQTTPLILNKYRECIHMLTFIGFPCLWIIYLLEQSDWIQSMDWYQKFNHHQMENPIINSVLITIWAIIQFVEFILCIISLLYCIQHNIHQQRPKEQYNTMLGSCGYNKKYSFSLTKPYNKGSKNNINGYIQKIQLLERQISVLQTDLIKSKQETLVANSQLSNDYNDELQERNQEYRALLSERDLLKTECENKKSLLNMKKQQIKQQQHSIKNLQQIREENISTINELKKKLNVSRKEMQKMQILLQIERQNVQKAQEYFENFT